MRTLTQRYYGDLRDRMVAERGDVSAYDDMIKGVDDVVQYSRNVHPIAPLMTCHMLAGLVQTEFAVQPQEMQPQQQQDGQEMQPQEQQDMQLLQPQEQQERQKMQPGEHQEMQQLQPPEPQEQVQAPQLVPGDHGCLWEDFVAFSQGHEAVKTVVSVSATANRVYLVLDAHRNQVFIACQDGIKTCRAHSSHWRKLKIVSHDVAGRVVTGACIETVHKQWNDDGLFTNTSGWKLRERNIEIAALHTF